MLKKVYKYEGETLTVEEKECHPQQLPLTSKYIAPYWFQAIQNVFKYEKRRDLPEVHKLADDSRIQKGLDSYKNKKIIKNVVTTHRGGDVHAEVESNGKIYTVIIKNFLPEKLPQYVHEREEYIANLFINCNCKDFSMAKYRSNSSIFCKHCCAVVWFLIDKFNMPRIFLIPELKLVGYQKSETEELETEIKALPLIHFTQYINILLLKKYRDMQPALGISVHKVNNKNNLEMDKPQWLTYVELKDVSKLIKGIAKAYKEMAKAQGQTDEQINDELDELLERPKKKHWWKFWNKGGIK